MRFAMRLALMACLMLFAGLQATAAQAAQKSFVLLPFTVNAPQSYGYLSKALPSSLLSKLNRPGVAQGRVGSTKATSAAQAKKALGGADYAIWGEVSVVGNDCTVTLHSVDKAGKELLQAFLRLVELLDTPSRIPVLAPMILREIHYYLLCGGQGGCLRLFSSVGTQANQIAEAISWLREHYADSLNMEELARRVNMAPSTFNRHFKQLTSLSPLQFQKRLRLYEAERLMLLEGQDAGTAALMVGYESASQFNR